MFFKYNKKKWRKKGRIEIDKVIELQEHVDGLCWRSIVVCGFGLGSCVLRERLWSWDQKGFAVRRMLLCLGQTADSIISIYSVLFADIITLLHFHTKLLRFLQLHMLHISHLTTPCRVDISQSPIAPG